MVNKLKQINWSVRKKHILFWVGIVGIIGNTVLPYYNLAMSDLTEWSTVWEVTVNVLQNPFLLLTVLCSVGASFLGVITDHTTAGLYDSNAALELSQPKRDES